MYQDAAAHIPGEAALELPAPEPRAPKSLPQRLGGWLSAAISFAVLVKVALKLGELNLAHVIGLIPRTPSFWLLFAATYLITPVAEWVIYRRLWGLPVAGIGALLRKLVSNELLLGYLGEVQFYAWARGKMKMIAAPFGAVKDVSILSALTGNLVTLAMLVGAWPLVSSGALGIETRTVFYSLAVVLATSFAILLFRRSLFSLRQRDLWMIAGIHTARTLLAVGLTAVMWHEILPGTEIDVWLAMATLKMLISRLPFVPNKEVVFAGLAVFLLGRDAQISDLIAMMAGITLASHLAVAGIFGSADLITSWSQRNEA